MSSNPLPPRGADARCGDGASHDHMLALKAEIEAASAIAAEAIYDEGGYRRHGASGTVEPVRMCGLHLPHQSGSVVEPRPISVPQHPQ